MKTVKKTELLTTRAIALEKPELAPQLFDHIL